MMKPPKQTAEQRKAHKQAIADRLAELTKSLRKPRKADARPRRWEKYAGTPDLHDPANSSGLALHLALGATARALKLTAEDTARAFCLWTLKAQEGTVITDSNTGTEVTEETATPLQLKASRLLPRAERLLLRLVKTHAACTLVGEAVCIGSRRKRPRLPHWQKRRLA